MRAQPAWVMSGGHGRLLLVGAAGPAARPAGGDPAERPVPPGLLVFGGRPQVRRITRAVLYQLAHSLVAASTWAGVSTAPGDR